MISSSASYRRVSTSGEDSPVASGNSLAFGSSVVTTTRLGGDGAEALNFNNRTRPATRRSLSDRIMDKIVAAAWVTVAAVIAYWTNFFYVLLNPTESGASRTLMQIAAVGFGTNTVLLLYLILYLPYVKKLHDSSAWEVYCPSVIPIMTVTGVVTVLVLIRAAWPVWGFLSPLILGVEAFGFLFGLHFIPALPF